jgi:hypothetical protein
LGKDALPDLSDEDEVHSEPTKVGDGVVALEEAVRVSLGMPEERATSKMAPFQLEEVLQKARTRNVSLVPPSPASPPSPAASPSVPSDVDRVSDRVSDRVTVPGHVPGAASPVESPVADVAHASHQSAPADEQPRDIGAIVSVLLAAVFVVLTCAVLLSR